MLIEKLFAEELQGTFHKEHIRKTYFSVSIVVDYVSWG